MLYNGLYDDIKNDIKGDFKKGKLNTNLSFFVYVFVFFLLGFLILGVLLKRRPYSIVADFNYLPAPVQEPTSGSVVMSALGKDIIIDFLAKYDINGKVIAVKDFNSVEGFSNRICPGDFVLGWGILGVQENIDRFERIEDIVNSNLFATLKGGNDEWYNDIGGNFTLNSSYSNNRFIPSNKKVKLSLNKIREGDNVRIRGYLSHAYTDDHGRSLGPSCIDSNSDLSCEVIYVTEVTWLKEM